MTSNEFSGPWDEGFSETRPDRADDPAEAARKAAKAKRGLEDNTRPLITVEGVPSVLDLPEPADRPYPRWDTIEGHEFDQPTSDVGGAMAGDRDLFDEYTAILEAFTDHDLQHLATLTPEGRAIQAKARQELQRHLDQIWAEPQKGPDGRHPVDIGGYRGVQAMLDIAGELVGNVEQAQEAAGDEVDRYWVDIVVKVDED